MIGYATMAHRSTQTTTLGELLAHGGLDRFPEHIANTHRPCSDDTPANIIAPGGYAVCIRCELIACQDPREELRRGSTIEIETQAQVWVNSMIR